MRQSLQFGKLLAAGCTDALAAEKNAIPSYFTTQVTAAVCAVLAQQDGITIGKDFKGSISGDTKRISQFLGQNKTA